MNIIVLIKQSRSAFLLLVLLVFGQLLWLAPAQAHLARVTAEFTPNQNNPITGPLPIHRLLPGFAVVPTGNGALIIRLPVLRQVFPLRTRENKVAELWIMVVGHYIWAFLNSGPLL